MFAVGFVTPLMFSNIAEAANFGKGGTAALFSDDQLNTFSAKNSNTTYSGGTWNTNISNDNCVMINGYRFKVVKTETPSSGDYAGKQILTLWSYNSTETDATKSFATNVKYEADKDWSDGGTITAAEAYNNSDLKTAMDGLLTTDESGNPNGGELYDSNFTYVKYTSTTDSNVADAYVWAPSKTEVESTAWGDGTNALTRAQRVVGYNSWLRSPDPGLDDSAYYVGNDGDIDYTYVGSDYLLRPALQILNQISHVFTTNVTIPTDGVFTADGSGTPTSYALNSTAAIVPTFTPATNGVTLDGTKIGIKTTDNSSGTYAMAGLLTEEADSTKKDTWANLNGTTANIAYMAQASSGNLDLSGVATGTDYTLKVFGLKTADTTVTELASGAITGLSKGADGKIHMKVGSTYNNGVATTLKGGAVVDLAGDASNAITLDSSGTDKTGKLNLGASTYTHSGDIAIGASGTLTVEGTGALAGTISGDGKIVIDGIVRADADKFTQTGGLEVVSAKTLTLTGASKTLGQTVSGTGKVVIDGTISADADKFTQTGGLEVKDSGDILTLTAGTLSKDVTNNGIVKLNGATLGGAHVTAGTLEFAKNISLDASYVAATTNKVDSDVTLTLTAGTLAGTVSGDGKIVIDGTISADADKFRQTGDLEVKNNLVFTSRGLNVSTVGGFTQASGSNVTVDASKIQADSNDPAKAMFIGVDDSSKLNVSAGNLTLSGTVQDGKYYVLVAGTAINAGIVTENTLWKNIDFPDILMADYEIKYDTNTADNPGSIALHVKSAVTSEEVNTSGLAAVQQGNITVAKEFTGEVENHLGMIANPKLAEKEKYDKAVWASYIRTKETTEGMKLGAGIEGNNTAQYNGAVVGVDFYSSRKAIAGMALSYTVGDIDSQSNGTSTVNKSKYYGISFYDRVTNGNTALIYDIGYIRGDNDINQYHNGKDTTSDVRTNTYTAGARWEAVIETGRSKVVPFAAFRYMRVNNGDYTNSHNVKIETGNQNLYIPKVGIAWTGDFIMPKSVWKWRPSVEAGYVWNLGDRNVESNIYSLTKVTGIDYDTVDKSSYYAKASMEFMCKNFTAGLSYRYLKGDAVRNNKWNINLSWSF